MLARYDIHHYKVDKVKVYVMYFKSLDEIDEVCVRALLFEAAMIDDQFDKKKKKK